MPGVVGSQEPKGSLQIPQAFMEPALGTFKSLNLLDACNPGDRWHYSHSADEETEAQSDASCRGTPNQKERGDLNPPSFCPGAFACALPSA